MQYEPQAQSKTDKEYVENLIKENLYSKPSEWKKVFNNTLEQLILNTQINDRKTLGSVVGIAVLGLIGFVALGFTIVGVIAGGVVGGVIGGYAGKKIKKKISRNKKLIFFEFYQISLNCHLQLYYNVFNDKKSYIGLNQYRFYVEKLIEEFRLIIYFKHMFSKKIQKRIDKIMKKFNEFMQRSQVATSIRLTLKLSKNVFNNYIQEQNQQSALLYEQNLAEVIARVLQPTMRYYAELINNDQSVKKQQNGEILLLYQKMQKFLFNPQIAQIQSNYSLLYELNPVTIQDQVKEMEQEMNLQDLKNKIKSMFQHSDSEIKEINNIIDEAKKEQNQQSDKQVIEINLDQKFNNANQPKDSDKKSNKNDIESYCDPKSEIFQEKNEVKLPKQQIFQVQQKIHQNEQNQQENNQIFFVDDTKSDVPQELQDDIKIKQQQSSQKAQNQENKSSNQIQEEEKQQQQSLQIQNQQDSNQEISSVKQQKQQQENQSSSEEQKIQSEKNKKSHTKKANQIYKMNSTNSIFNQEDQIQVNQKQNKNINNDTKQTVQKSPNKQQYSSNDLDQPLDQEIRKSISQVLGRHDSISGHSVQKQKKDEEIDQKFLELKQLYQQDAVKTWEKVIQKNTITIYKKLIPPNPCVLVRAESDINGCEMNETFDQIYLPKLRCKWDTVALEFEIFDSIDENSDFLYFVIDPGLGVTRRDFVQKRSIKWDFPEKGQVSIIFFSSLHPLKPDRKNHLRAQTYIAGYVLSPIDDGKSVHLTILTQCDVKGIVPKYIVNYVAARAPPKWIEQLQKAVIDYRKEKKKLEQQQQNEKCLEKQQK